MLVVAEIVAALVVILILGVGFSDYITIVTFFPVP